MRTILLTGYPGFIGARLIPKLLADDPEAKVVALVEPRMVDRAKPLDRLEILPGDITDRRLGLDDATYQRLTRETVAVHHLAAIYDLAVGSELAERVNVEGTQHVVDFTKRCERLERHNYVSTAYVAGMRSGLVLEDELAEGQAFKNHYESTKFAAEVIVRTAMDEVPTTIFRPAIVVGDSRTGETQKFDGPYFMLRTIAAARGPIAQIGRGDAPFNVVPVDFVVEAIAAGARDADAAGKTLHLVDPEPVSSAELCRILAREYAGKEPTLKVPPGLVDRLLKYAPVRRAFGGAPRESIVYLNHPVRFDVTNAGAILGRSQGLRCPRFGEYAPAMVRFFREHEHDPAFVPRHLG